ncbi:MAG: NAD(P)H-hydrate epimerase, partial [Acidobacteriota bacterium]|nr:NAD(P)H-hydrate epimerase [Acidobacteriota bacterium]
MLILDSDGARLLDRRAIDELGMAPLVLMENAAVAAVAVIERRYPDARRVVVVCGRGNNGGDGMAVARHLHVAGYRATVFLLSAER